MGCAGAYHSDRLTDGHATRPVARVISPCADFDKSEDPSLICVHADALLRRKRPIPGASPFYTPICQQSDDEVPFFFNSSPLTSSPFDSFGVTLRSRHTETLWGFAGAFSLRVASTSQRFHREFSLANAGITRGNATGDEGHAGAG